MSVMSNIQTASVCIPAVTQIKFAFDGIMIPQDLFIYTIWFCAAFQFLLSHTHTHLLWRDHDHRKPTIQIRHADTASTRGAGSPVTADVCEVRFWGM